MRRTSLYTIAFALICMQWVACGTSNGTQDEASALSHETVVLGTQSLEALVEVSESSSGTQTLVFADAAAVEEIDPGNVIVAGPCTLKPEGFLLRVANVTERSGLFYVDATQATLEEAVVDVAVNETFTTTQQDINTFEAATGVEILPEPVVRDLSWSPGAIELDINNVVVHDVDGDLATTDDQVRVDGVLGVVPQYDIEIDIQFFGVEKFRFENRNQHYSNLQLDSGVPIEVSHTVTVASIEFAPVVINVGIPLVFTPRLDVNVGVDGDINGAVQVGVSITATTGASVLYEGGEWSSDWRDPASDLEVAVDGPYLDATEGSVKAWVGPEGSFKLYGVVGPTAGIRAYIDFNANLMPEREWQLHAGVDAFVELEATIPIIGYFVGYGEVFDYNWLVAEGTF